MEALVAETTLGSLEGKPAWGELTIGVLALQGAFAEHCVMFRRLGVGAVKEVRVAGEMEGCDGLAIPGGESTAMVLIAKPGGHGGGDKVQEVAANSGIMDAVTGWVRERKMPTWGTCAGLILMSNELAQGTVKEGGQEYAQSMRMLGNGRCEAYCFDGKTRLAHIRGKMRKKVWVSTGDVILLGLRDFQDEKADVILKYLPEEARSLKQYGELPADIRVNETENFAEEDENDEYFDFDDVAVDEI